MISHAAWRATALGQRAPTRAPAGRCGSCTRKGSRVARRRCRGRRRVSGRAPGGGRRARTYEGVPGVALVTPLRLADGSAVFVDRGWAPSPDAAHVDEQAYQEPDTADVLGLGFPAPRGRGDVDPARLEDSLPYPVLPFILQQFPQLPSSTVLYRPLPPGLMRWPAPALDDGPHLSYAIQWFSFAVIILGGSVALFRKSLAGGPGGSRHDAVRNPANYR